MPYILLLNEHSSFIDHYRVSKNGLRYAEDNITFSNLKLLLLRILPSQFPHGLYFRNRNQENTWMWVSFQNNIIHILLLLDSNYHPVALTFHPFCDVTITYDLYRVPIRSQEHTGGWRVGSYLSRQQKMKTI